MSKQFKLKILGRTIEHLGTQMYKHRAPSIAELVANCYDAGAKNVWIVVPEKDEYDQGSSLVSVRDDGEGMTSDDVQAHYLVIGRNRRAEDQGVSHGRKVMGRKGIGKLAGFGLASKMTITTWTGQKPMAVRFSMSLEQLKCSPGAVEDIAFPWDDAPKDKTWSDSGTLIQLSGLKHASPLETSSLAETLARRFSRTTRGQMTIHLNAVPVVDPDLETVFHHPDDGTFAEERLPSGNVVKYRYSFSKSTIKSKEMQGFAIYAHERTAQAPPFFFNVESTASGQHSTKYVTGEIKADYLDDGIDDESDLTSTDRQELDWEKEELRELREWGDKLTRRILIQCAEMKGSELKDWVLEEPEFKDRLVRLDRSAITEVSKFLVILGQRAPHGDGRTKDLADALIRAYEFRSFHDVVDDINNVADDPAKLEDLLARLHDWKVLESRAILEIVKGRLAIIERLRNMIVQNRPETPAKATEENPQRDNLHDLLADYPWLFNPEWQVFAEEKTVGKQLKEWGVEEMKEDMDAKRVDFLAFHKDVDILVIIELKRPGHSVELAELQRLQRYQNEFSLAYQNCLAVLVHEGEINVRAAALKSFEASDSFRLFKWSDLFKQVSRFYSHYKAVLDGDVSDPAFARKQNEVLRTRTILAADTAYRGRKARANGVGDTEV